MKGFRKPDVKAPRFRPKKERILTNKFYKDFRKKYPKYKAYTDAALGAIIVDYNEKLWMAAIDHRDGVELPQGLGNIFIGTCDRPKIKYNTDFGQSIKNDTLTRLKNYESDGYLAKIFYTNYSSKYMFAYREFWEFKGARNFTRQVRHTYPTEWKKYIVVENTMLISKLYKKAKNIVYGLDARKEVDFENYNEFNLD